MKNIEQNPNESDQRLSLMKELKREEWQHHLAAGIKSKILQLLFWISIISSFLPIVNIVIQQFDSNLVNVSAAIPGLVILISNTFKYSEKIRWHKMKEKEYQALWSKLKYEEYSVKAVSKLRSELERKLEEARVMFETPAPKNVSK